MSVDHRHSATGHTVTVFGATSFLGRYLISKLGKYPSLLTLTRDTLADPPILYNNPVAKAGTQVVVPYRDADEARHLRVCGDLGQIVPMVRFLQSLPLSLSLTELSTDQKNETNRNGT